MLCFGLYFLKGCESMRIGICDDTAAFRTQILEKLHEIDALNDDDLIIEYCDGAEVIESDDELDLLFLDIEMPILSGMDLLKKHPHHLKNTKVVLLTSYDDYVMEGYEVGVFRYLKKPARTDKLIEIFEALKKENALLKQIEISCNTVNIKISLDSIIYIERCMQANKCMVVTGTGRIETTMTLKNFLEILPAQYFNQPHKSFIVNLRHIISINSKNKTLQMSNNDLVDIAQRRYKDFEQLYHNFLFSS